MNNYYVVGNKASRSLSPTIFNYWFKKYKIKAKYKFLELDENSFDKRILEKIKEKNTKGLNITIPFKKKIIKHLNNLDKHSKEINAVNCVSIGGRTKGINTDWIGYYNTLPKNKNLRKKKVLLIGYGGAALAIHYVLMIKGFKNITIVNRSKKKLRFVNKTKFTSPIKNLDKHLSSSDLIINSTPLNPLSERHVKLISNNTIVSDIVYKPKETEFLKQFPNNNKIYGISMLLQQAVPCFNMWFGFSPAIDNKLMEILNEKIR